MIHSVRANQPGFKSVDFKPGLNVVLADRTLESTRKDSRNGLGKTTLIEIIHFGLGANPKRGEGLLSESLDGWEFSVELSLRRGRVLVSRNTEKPSQFFLEGDLTGWPLKIERETRRPFVTMGDWRSILGEEMFGLSDAESGQFGPSFRSLISYFVRRSPDAFSTPFEHYRKQLEWDKQVHNAFLLGLSWKDAADFQIVKDQENSLGALKKAARTGAIKGLVGTTGELEAERVRLHEEVARSGQALETFRVHPQYAEIQERANRLTSEIHKLTNENVSDTRLLRFYEASVGGVQQADQYDVAQIYEEAGLVLGESVRRRLEDVRNFHEKLISNRASFLQAEIEAIRRRTADRDAALARLIDERAADLETLRTHGALDEHTRLQQNHIAKVALLKDLEVQIQNARKIEEGSSALRIEREVLLQRSRRDYDERREQRQRAIQLFNEHSQALYQAPGRLVIDVYPGGFKFSVEIERSASHGVSKMKVYCYDLTLAQLWPGTSDQREPRPAALAGRRGPGFLIHDSTIYEGVDERQVALALEHAARVSTDEGFQYICALNSDSIPQREFSPNFDLNQFVRLRLTDATPDGSLLGMRF